MGGCELFKYVYAIVYFYNLTMLLLVKGHFINGMGATEKNTTTVCRKKG